MNQNGRTFIQSVQRALDIIDCFDSLDKQLTLTEISEKVGLNISTVHGILQTLAFNSYIDKAPDSGKYKLGLKLLEKGILVAEGLDLRDIGHPYLKTLTDKYQETSHLCLFQEGVYCIDKVEPPNGYLVMSSKVGRPLSLHATASGKIFLSSLNSQELARLQPSLTMEPMTEKTFSQWPRLCEELQTIRERGYAVENEEAEIGAYSIAVAIKNHRGKMVGTISLCGPVTRVKTRKEEIITDIVAAGQAISQQLGYK